MARYSTRWMMERGRWLLWSSVCLSIFGACGPVTLSTTLPSGRPEVSAMSLSESMVASTPPVTPQVIPSPHASPVPVSDGAAGLTRARPAVLGVPVVLPSVTITVTGVTRDDAAAQALKESARGSARPYHDPPPGMRYVLVTMQLTNHSTETIDTNVEGQLRFGTGVTGHRHRAYYQEMSITLPQPFGEPIAPGSMREGQQAFVVPHDETKLLWYGFTTRLSTTEQIRYVALDPGAQVMVPVFPPYSPVTSSRAVPLPFGTTLTNRTWTITQTGFVRGDAAMQQAKQYQPLVADPQPPPGFEYVLVTSRQMYIRDDPGPIKDFYTASFGITGDQNILYQREWRKLLSPHEDLAHVSIFQGGTLEFVELFLIPMGERNLLYQVFASGETNVDDPTSVSVEDLFIHQMGQHFVALEDGAHVIGDASRLTTPFTDVGRDPTNPAAVGTAVRVQGWEARVVDVQRGEVATSLASTRGLDRLEDGQEFVAVQIQLTYTGRHTIDSFDSLLNEHFVSANDVARSERQEPDTAGSAIEIIDIASYDQGDFKVRLFPGAMQERRLLIIADNETTPLILVYRPSWKGEEVCYLSLD